MTLLLLALVIATEPADADREEEARIAMIARVAPSAVCVFHGGGNEAGSGVLISADGFALTNFHVVGNRVWFQCGLSDGNLYDAVIVGHDPVGDIALIKLIGRDDFPFAELGDSDALTIGQSVVAMGNPFKLAADFQPTVTAGILSGIHRYQSPTGGILEYADCLQTDASVNPGNSGGPLLDDLGRVIGINGRISFEKRARLNAGVAYAVSINQIKRFLDHLQGGLVVEHGSLGVIARTNDDGRVEIQSIDESSDAFRRGLRTGDILVSLAGRSLGSANELQNILGSHPADWEIPMTFARGNETVATRVRLAAAGRRPQPPTPPQLAPQAPPAIASLFQARPGLANAYFHDRRRDQLWSTLTTPAWRRDRSEWKLTFRDAQGATLLWIIGDEEASLHWNDRTVSFEVGSQPTGDDEPFLEILLLSHHWRTLLLGDAKPPSDARFVGSFPNDADQRELILQLQRPGPIELRFDKTGKSLVGLERRLDPPAGRVSLRFSEPRSRGNLVLPHVWQAVGHPALPGELTLQSMEMTP